MLFYFYLELQIAVLRPLLKRMVQVHFLKINIYILDNISMLLCFMMFFFEYTLQKGYYYYWPLSFIKHTGMLKLFMLWHPCSLFFVVHKDSCFFFMLDKMYSLHTCMCLIEWQCFYSGVPSLCVYQCQLSFTAIKCSPVSKNDTVHCIHSNAKDLWHKKKSLLASW